MCGRYVQTAPAAEIARMFGVEARLNLRPRYNIAPTQDIAVVRPAQRRPANGGGGGGGDGGRELVPLRWGLVPSWADDPAIGNRLINARAESVADKPSFRGPFRKRRCLIPADGFYEWQAVEGRKQPYLIRRRDHLTFAFAGLWDHWHGPKDKPGQRLAEPLETAAIITTTANAVVAPLHTRMPVILAPADWDLWLDPHAPAELAQTVLRPCPDDWLEAIPVSTRVNNVRHDDPACIAPLDAPPRLL